MTVFYLVRHGLHLFGGEAIAGRTPGVLLSQRGEEECLETARRLSLTDLAAVYTSPLERTRQTAEIIAAPHALVPIVVEEITELDFGDWMGRHLDDLRPQDRWKHFNTFRSGTRAPNGELQLEAQLRIVSFMTHLCERHPGQRVALVSHGDVIKAAVAHYLGVPIDLFQRIEISTASVSIIVLQEYGPWVLTVNNLGALPEPTK